MRNGRAVLDAGNLKACCLQRADSGLATRTRALDENSNLVKAMLHSGLGSGLGGHLSSERRGLTRALEADGASGLPRNHVALRISDAHDRVVERGLDVSSTNGDVLAISATDALLCILFLLPLFS